MYTVCSITLNYEHRISVQKLSRAYKTGVLAAVRQAGRELVLEGGLSVEKVSPAAPSFMHPGHILSGDVGKHVQNLSECLYL